MRAVDCPACGKHFEAATDDALVQLGVQHAKEVHADQNLTEDQVRAIVQQGAKDA
jgi:predicted small metal-binding protein